MLPKIVFELVITPCFLNFSFMRNFRPRAWLFLFSLLHWHLFPFHSLNFNCLWWNIFVYSLNTSTLFLGYQLRCFGLNVPSVKTPRSGSIFYHWASEPSFWFSSCTNLKWFLLTYMQYLLLLYSQFCLMISSKQYPNPENLAVIQVLSLVPHHSL